MSVIRPKANIVFSIGLGLITDFNAAIIELIKNSYDADAENVIISVYKKGEMISRVIVEDDGHGMTLDVVKNNWLVPGFSSKIDRKISPEKKRFLLGSKGLGRFGVNYIGRKIELTTVSKNEKTELSINWNQFSRDKYLDEIDIDVKTYKEVSKSMTKIDMTDINDIYFKETKNLGEVIRKLVYPLSNDVFSIFLEIVKDENSESELVLIEPISRQSILQLFQYKLFGEIRVNNNELIPDIYFEYYDNNRKLIKTKIDSFIFPPEYHLREGIKFELNYFERGIKDIEFLLELSKNIKGIDYYKKNDIRRFLSSISGVSIYRSKFRISPYGDSDFDWLELDRKRVQNTKLIALNNTFGEIFIGTEEETNLIEKSARDGLQKNEEFIRFKEIIELLYERFAYEKNMLSTTKPSISTIDFLPSFSKYDIKEKNRKIKLYVTHSNLKDEEKQQIANILDVTEIQYDRMKKILAVYEKEVTLGFLVDYVIHEIQNPSFRVNEGISNVFDELDSRNECYETIKGDLDIIKDSIDNISRLADFLMPLASTKKRIMNVNVNRVIEEVSKVLDRKLTENRITIENKISSSIMLKLYEGHLHTVLINLIDNGIYWLQFIKENRRIVFDFYEDEKYMYILYSNNGPIIDPSILKYNLLFEPGQSLKVNGTGLGLTIVGHNLALNKAEISVIDISNSDMNVNFELKFLKE